MITLFTIRDKELVQKKRVKKAFDLPDGDYEMEIKKKSRRSTEQNRYYWGVCVKMIHDLYTHFGNDVTAQEIHDGLRWKFNSKEIFNEITGEVDRVPQSTADLSKEDFGKYIEKIQRYAAMELDLVIPDPGKQLAIEY